MSDGDMGRRAVDDAISALAETSARTGPYATVLRRLKLVSLAAWRSICFSTDWGVASDKKDLRIAAVRPFKGTASVFAGPVPIDSRRASEPIDLTATYAGRSVLITGAGGTIGLELCRQVINTRPRKLVLLEISEHALYQAVRSVERLTTTHDGMQLPDVVPVLGSVSDAALVTEVLKAHGTEVVIHAAAYKHVHLVEANPRAGLVNNALGTATLALAAKECAVARFVLVSTDKAVRPVGIMGASKRLAEMIVQDLASRSVSTVFSVVRFGNVIGSSGSVIPLFREQIEAGGPVTLTHPETTRYFMTCDDAAHLALAAGAIAKGGEIFLLDMGLPTAIRDIARRMIAGSGRSVKDAANPTGDIAIVTTGLRLGEKLHEQLTTGSITAATRHPRIFRLSEPCLSEIETAAALRDLRNAVDHGGEPEIRDVLRRWLPDCQMNWSGAAAATAARSGANAPQDATAPQWHHKEVSSRQGRSIP